MMTMPVDAIPDLSENQVIVFTDWMGRSPQEIEDQVTYPLSVNLQGLAGVKVVRSSSEFNFSMITIIFDDATDYYFARQRVLERLVDRLDVPAAGRDALPGPRRHGRSARSSGTPSRATARTWASCGRSRTGTSATSSTASRAWPRSPSVGGAPREYQIDLDPNKLRAYGISLGEVYSAVAAVELVRRRPGDPQGERRVPDPLGRLDREPRRHPRTRSSPSATATPIYVKNLGDGPDRARRSAAACWRRTARRSSAAWC